MIIPGSLVACRYQEMYYGIVVKFSAIGSEEIRRDLARQYRKLVPHFAVHFLENDEYDCILLEDISEIGEADVHQHEGSRHFTHYKKLIADGRLVIRNGYYVAVDAPEPTFPAPCGSPVPYEVITSTRYYTSENYLKQLFEKNDLPFSKEQVLALSCVQNYKEVVLGRYPSMPNYKNYAYFGNKLLRDYSGVYLSPNTRLLVNDVCYIDSEVVRVERITTVESVGQVQFLVSAVNSVGVPFIGISAQIVTEQSKTAKNNFSFETKKPRVYKNLIEPISAENIVDGDFLPQSDADNRFGNNFTSFSALCLQKNDTRLASASAIDLLTAKFQFVQNKIIPLNSVAEIVANLGEQKLHSKEKTSQQDQELQSSKKSTDLQLKKSKSSEDSKESVFKTPQGVFQPSESQEPLQMGHMSQKTQETPQSPYQQVSIGFQQCRLLTQISYAFDLAVEMSDQILSPTEIRAAVIYYNNHFANNNQDQSQNNNFEKEYETLFVRKGLRCCFCGELCGEKDLCFIFGLPMLKRPLFQAVFNPPILLGCHANCAQKTPEVDVIECGIESDVSMSHGSENEVDSDQEGEEVEEKEEPLIELLLANKHARNFINKHSTLIYDGLRKALKPDRIGLKCIVCGKQGAVIGCFNQYCSFTAHFPCVKHLFGDGDGKTFYCEKHRKQ